jgi:hypothetical protein
MILSAIREDRKKLPVGVEYRVEIDFRGLECQFRVVRKNGDVSEFDRQRFDLSPTTYLEPNVGVPVRIEVMAKVML